MSRTLRGILSAVLVGMVGLASVVSVSAADFPKSGITLVVPWSAGGITDRVARVFAPLWARELKQSVTILNQPGASGAIGTDSAYGRAADGYNVILSAETPGIFQTMGLSKLSFEDFDPIMMMVKDTKVLVVPAKSSYHTIDDLIRDVKARPGKVRMSYSGPGASGHIQGLLLKKAGMDISMTPFGGGSESLLATIGGQVDFTFANTITVVDYVKSGQLRALAVHSDEPAPLFPDAPPITKALPSLKPYIHIYFPSYLLVKKGTPAQVKKILTDTALAASRSKEWIEFTDSNDYTRLHSKTQEQIAAYCKDWTSQVSWLLYDAGAAKYSPADFQIPRP
ncbi:MAG: tripartite tricarboxylate transporter substrate binding protein [Clostridia bacterium]|nr:tripartite tricarboxylate transporter substrate binding protein [Clostridia bacterium]